MMNSEDAMLLTEIIDELNPDYTPCTDETCIHMQEDHGVYQRGFEHRNGNKFLIEWTVWYGTPETVKTVFNSVQ